MKSNDSIRDKDTGHDDSTDTDHLQAAIALSGTKRDILTVLARNGGLCGLDVKQALADLRGTTPSHAGIYEPLDDLADHDLVEKTAADGRTNNYSLTRRGERVLQAYAEHVLDASTTLDVKTARELRADGSGQPEYESLADAERDGKYPCFQCETVFDSEQERESHACGGPAVLADGGIITPDDDARPYSVTVPAISVIDGVEVDITVRDAGAGERDADVVVLALKEHLGVLAAAFDKEVPPNELEEIPQAFVPPMKVAWDEKFADDGGAE